MKLSEIKKDCVKFVKEFCKEYNLVKSQIVDKSLVDRGLVANELIKPTFGVKVYGTKENIINMLNDCFYENGMYVDNDCFYDEESGMYVDVKEENNGLVSVILPYHFEEN